MENNQDQTNPANSTPDSPETVSAQPTTEANNISAEQNSAPIEQQPVVSDTQPQPVDSATVENEQTTPEQPAAPIPQNNQAPKKKRNHILVVILAIVVFILLAGAAVFAFMSSNKDKNEPQTSNTATQTEPQETGPTSEDAQSAITDVEKEVNSQNEDADFANDALNDANLNL